MFEYSRALYRHVEPLMEQTDDRSRMVLLRSAELAVARITENPQHADRLSRWLFREIRHLFTLQRQPRLRNIVASLCRAVAQDVDARGARQEDVFGQPRRCPVLTRQGTACQREPLGNGYCPSHQHLVEHGERPSGLRVA